MAKREPKADRGAIADLLDEYCTANAGREITVRGSTGSEFHKPFTADDQEALNAIRDRAIAQMDATACKGDRANLDACTWQAERSCPKRENTSCPRQIIAFEGRQALFVRGGKTSEQVYAEMGIPAATATLLAANQYDLTTQAMAAVESWWKRTPRPRVLVLSGPSGTGKTFAAAYRASQSMGRVVHASDFKSLSERSAELLRIGFLVVDDLGTESADWFDRQKAAICNLLCQRIDGGQFTVLPTNLKLADIERRYDGSSDETGRLIRRIKDLGSYMPLATAGNLRRLV